MNNSRRNFIKNASIVSIGFAGLNHFLLSGCNTTSGLNYGPLLPASEGVLSLPKGFTSTIISRKGDLMSDGLFSPGMNSMA